MQHPVVTAARSGYVRLATWAEIDTARRVSTIAAARMKAKRGAMYEILPDGKTESGSDLEALASVQPHTRVMVDDEAIFVTSVNLTEAALDRILQIGLLVRDHALAVTMTRHFPTLIERPTYQRLICRDNWVSRQV